MYSRYASAITTGTLMTFALLYAMQALIHLQPGASSEPRDPTWVNFVSVPRKDPPPPRQKPVVDPEKLKKAPVPPRAATSTGPGIGVRVTVPPTGSGPVTTRLEDLRQPDGPLISIVRVQPTYPGAAEARELEGWVDVSFDVTTEGRVINVDVISSSHRIFESAAIKAAERFRFRAPVVDGVPQYSSGIEYRFRFRMNDS